MKRKAVILLQSLLLEAVKKIIEMNWRAYVLWT